MPDVDPTAEFVIEMALQLEDEERVELLRAFNEANWRKVQRFIEELVA